MPLLVVSTVDAVPISTMLQQTNRVNPRKAMTIIIVVAQSAGGIRLREPWSSRIGRMLEFVWLTLVSRILLLLEFN